MDSQDSLPRIDSDADQIPNYQLLSLNPTLDNYEENALHASIARKTNIGRRASVTMDDVPIPQELTNKPQTRQRRASLSVDQPQVYMQRRSSLSVENTIPTSLQRRPSLSVDLTQATQQAQQSPQKRTSLMAESSFPFMKKNSPSSDSSNPSQKLKETASPLGSRMELFTSMNSLAPSRVNSVNNLSFAKSSMNLSIGADSIDPAFLSEIARNFASKIAISVHSKDGIDYPDTFTGVEAINTLCSIVRIGDRNLSVILGRTLESQGLIIAIKSHSKLRDSAREFYKCPVLGTAASNEYISGPSRQDMLLPTGVFTLLTDCYSATCYKDSLCYSVSCPRRLDHRIKNIAMSRAGTGVNNIKKEQSVDTPAQLWFMSVPKEIVESVSDSERKRQEIIFEIVTTEKEYVDDLLTLQTVFIQPLLEGYILSPSRKEKLISSLFLNIGELYNINLKLKRKLLERQKENHIVNCIGDIFVSVADTFYPYIDYGAGQAWAKFLLDEERQSNPEFANFLKESEKKKECRKLPLESFLARPTTRMGRYPLFLKSAFERVSDDHPDKIMIPKAMETIRDILSKINIEAGKSENQLKISRLQAQIFFNPGEEVELSLNSENRKLIREGVVQLKRSTSGETEIVVFLFNHMLLMTKKKENGTYKVFKKPIPLELLLLKPEKTASNEAPVPLSSRASLSNLQKMATTRSSVSSQQTNTVSKGNTFTIIHLGKNGGIFTFFTYSAADKQSWIDAIEDQQSLLMNRKQRFDLVTFTSNFFKISNKVNCSASYLSSLIIGTDEGLYVGPEKSFTLGGEEEEVSNPFVKVLDLEKITQVDVLTDYDMIIILADRIMFSFPLDILDITNTTDQSHSIRKGKRIGTHVSFFRLGICSDRVLVCAVKSTSLTATIKVLEPVGLGGNKLRGKFGKLFRTTNDSLRVYKEFYIPTESRSVHFLRTKLCVACTKGFEIVDLESLNTQGLLDPSDDRLDFINKKESVKPISIFRVADGEFLLCYNEFGFFVDKLGRRCRGDALFHWTGQPTNFAYVAPFVIAFEPWYIEIRQIETGEIQQIIPTNNLKCLNTHMDCLHCTLESTEYQQVVKLVLISDVE